MTRAELADAPGTRVYTPHKRRLSADEREFGREADESSIDFDATLWPQVGVNLIEEEKEDSWS